MSLPIVNGTSIETELDTRSFCQQVCADCTAHQPDCNAQLFRFGLGELDELPDARRASLSFGLTLYRS